MGEPERRRATWEEFVRLFGQLQEESSARTVVVVVEGERDRRSLRALGLRGPIELVNEGRSLAALAARLARERRRVVVLTDWDVRGGRLAHRLRDFLSAETVGLDLDFRRRLANVLRGELTHVEGLAGWARRVAEEAGTPLDGPLAEPS